MFQINFERIIYYFRYKLIYQRLASITGSIDFRAKCHRAKAVYLFICLNLIIYYGCLTCKYAASILSKFKTFAWCLLKNKKLYLMYFSWITFEKFYCHSFFFLFKAEITICCLSAQDIKKKKTLNLTFSCLWIFQNKNFINLFVAVFHFSTDNKKLLTVIIN